MGALMTSLEMAGVSFTLLKMTLQWAECLGMIPYLHIMLKSFVIIIIINDNYNYKK